MDFNESLKAFLENANGEPKKLVLYRQINVCRWETVKEELDSNLKKKSIVAYENDGWKHVLVRCSGRYYCEIFHNDEMIDRHIYV